MNEENYKYNFNLRMIVKLYTHLAFLFKRVQSAVEGIPFSIPHQSHKQPLSKKLQQITRPHLAI